MIELSTETRVYIYGAGRMGKLLGGMLTCCDVCLDGYIDNGCNDIEIHSVGRNIPVYSVDEFKTKYLSDANPMNFLIVIGIGNVLEHDRILKNELYFFPKTNCIYKRIDDLEYGIFDFMWDIANGIERLSSKTEFWEIIKANRFESPKTRVFSTRELHVVKQMNPRIYMDTTAETEIDKVCKYAMGKAERPKWCDVGRTLVKRYGYAFSEEEGKMWFDTFLEQRCRVYKDMDRIFCAHPDFLEHAPICVEYDEDFDLWYVFDGNNRLAYLKYKGITEVPCRIIEWRDRDIWDWNTICLKKNR